MIHYHGGPITPETCALRVWKGRHAFVSFAAPVQIKLAAAVCQSLALDNGAFSLWRAGKPTDWSALYDWYGEWLPHPACDWAVIPDVIEGTEAENDALVSQWPFKFGQGVPVWHLNESVARLKSLAANFPRVALGSTREFDVSSPRKCLARLADVLPHISTAGTPVTKLHGLRMLNPALTSRIPLSSADSTNVARNIGIDSAWRGTYTPATKETRADVLVERIESTTAPSWFDELRYADREYDLFSEWEETA